MPTCNTCNEASCICGKNVRRLRSGPKVIPDLVPQSGAPRQDKTLLYPGQGQRSTLKRKAMTDVHTLNIAGMTLGGDAGPATYMHKARVLDSLNGPVAHKLKDNGVARCHVLADSNVRIIVSTLYEGLKAEYKTNPSGFTLPAALNNFIQAMTAGVNADTIAAWMMQDIRNNNNAKLEDVLDWLSHGAGNLYFGDAERNGKILHGLDTSIENGKPTRNAAAIIDAVNGLRIPFAIKAAALQPTRRRDNGMALSSSHASAYVPETRFEKPHAPGFQERHKTI